MIAYAYDTTEDLVMRYNLPSVKTEKPLILDELKRRGLTIEECKKLYPEYFL